jgi:hypothetical protein
VRAGHGHVDQVLLVSKVADGHLVAERQLRHNDANLWEMRSTAVRQQM